MTEKTKILFVYTTFSSFVEADFAILAKNFAVRKLEFKPVKGLLSNMIQLIRQFFLLLVYLPGRKGCYIWFADYHSLLPVLMGKLMGKKSWLVIGGYDAVRVRSLRYGAFMTPFRSFFSATSMRHSSCNLAVSRYIERHVRVIAPRSRIQLIKNGVSLATQQNERQKQAENHVLTVAIVANKRTFYLKGLDTFIEVARRTPHLQFGIVGIDTVAVAGLLNDLPKNLTLTGKIPHHELIPFYEKSRLYCQLSRSESFGLSVVEAINAGCYPVVTRAGGLPELIGDTGTIVPHDAALISEILTRQCALYNPDEMKKAAVKIRTDLSLAKREEKINQLLSNDLTLSL